MTFDEWVEKNYHLLSGYVIIADRLDVSDQFADAYNAGLDAGYKEGYALAYLQARPWLDPGSLVVIGTRSKARAYAVKPRD